MEGQFEDDVLIGLIQKFSFIYNKKEKDFRSKLAKQNVWVTISQVLGSSVQDCEQRWKVLRTRYVKEKKNVKVVTHSGAEAYQDPTWPLFKAMGFIDEHIVPRRTIGNIKRAKEELPCSSTSAAPTSLWDSMEVMTQQSEEMMTQQSEEMSSPEDEEVEGAGTDAESEGTSAPIPSTSGTPQGNRHRAQTSVLRKAIGQTKIITPSKQREGKFMEAVSKSLTGLAAFLENKTPAPATTAEEYFGKSMVEVLKTIRNKKRRGRLQSEIMVKLMNARSGSDDSE